MKNRPFRIGITERGDAAHHFPAVCDAFARNQVDGLIVVTKDPAFVAAQVEQHGFAYKHPIADAVTRMVVHCTITGLPKEYEPGVPTARPVGGYYDLLRRLGPDNVVLRVDPIVPHGYLLRRALGIVRLARGRLRVSFLDAYPHVRARLKKAGLDQPEWEGLHAPLEARQAALEKIEVAYAEYNPERTVEVCGEPDIKCRGCVSKRDLKVFGVGPEELELAGQRPACKCLAVKYELLKERHPCKHGCLYCYWKDGEA